MEKRLEFIPVQRQRLPDDLAERIRASIAAGEFRPGDQLPPIVAMARTFRVATTTVREALIRLEARQVVEIRHGVGVFIAA